MCRRARVLVGQEEDGTGDPARVGQGIRRNTGAGATGTVRIGSVPSGLHSVVPPAVASFRAAHPDIELTLTESQLKAIIRDLRAGNLDLGIIATAHGQSPPQSTTLVVTTLIKQPLMVAVASQSPIARRRSISLPQLRAHAWLLPSRDRLPEYRSEIDHIFEQAGYTPKLALELADDIASQA